MHGVTPNAVRENSAQLKAFPRISFKIAIKGDVEMEYRIKKIDFELRFVGKRYSIKLLVPLKIFLLYGINPMKMDSCEN